MKLTVSGVSSLVVWSGMSEIVGGTGVGVGVLVDVGVLVEVAVLVAVAVGVAVEVGVSVAVAVGVGVSVAVAVAVAVAWRSPSASGSVCRRRLRRRWRLGDGRRLRHRRRERRLVAVAVPRVRASRCWWLWPCRGWRATSSSKYRRDRMLSWLAGGEALAVGVGVDEFTGDALVNGCSWPRCLAASRSRSEDFLRRLRHRLLRLRRCRRRTAGPTLAKDGPPRPPVGSVVMLVHSSIATCSPFTAECATRYRLCEPGGKSPGWKADESRCWQTGCQTSRRSRR